MYIHKTPSLSFALFFFYQRLKKILREIESLENFIVKKKIDLEIEASNEYSNLVSRRRIRSRGRAAESAQLSRAFLFLCTFPTPLLTRADLPFPYLEAPFLRRVAFEASTECLVGG